MTEPVIVPYLDSSEVDQSHRNKVVITSVFKLSDDCNTLRDVTKHVLLKEFASCTVSDDNESYWESEIKRIYTLMPLCNYDAQQDHFANCVNFQELKHEDDWENLPRTQLVFTKYRFAESVGCGHYVRGCQKRCETCQKYYPCRICHDQAEDHQFPRRDTVKVKCNYCETEQAFSTQCSKCGKLFATQSCETCKILCALGRDAKPIYHCQGCGLCNVGYRESNVHCSKCGQCYKKAFYASHKCFQEQNDCAVCLLPIMHSIYGKITPDCLHSLHVHCYRQLISSGVLKCPVCRRFLLIGDDRADYSKKCQESLMTTFLPRELVGQRVQVKCNECQHTFATQLWGLYQCASCGQFNCDVVTTLPPLTFEEAVKQRKDALPHLPTIEDVNAVLQYLFKDIQLSDIMDQINIALNEDTLDIFIRALRYAPKSIDELKRQLNLLMTDLGQAPEEIEELLEEGEEHE